CRPMDRAVIASNERVSLQDDDKEGFEGVPPLHCRCRCSTEAVRRRMTGGEGSAVVAHAHRSPHSGLYERNLASAERDAQAARLRAQHWTYQQIADELGYPDKSVAYRAVQRALKAAIREPGEELLALELERLDRLARAAEEVLEAHHVKVAGGEIVYDEAGQPLEDTKPVLEAIDRLLK